MLLEPFGPNLRARHHRQLSTLQWAAAAGAVLLALSSTGDVLLLGVLLGVAAADVTAGAAGVLGDPRLRKAPLRLPAETARETAGAVAEADTRSRREQEP